jgi:transcriptional regulator with XRE-family HTH domain
VPARGRLSSPRAGHDTGPVGLTHPGVAYSVSAVDELLGTLAHNLRRYRALRGFSATELAQRSHVARATLSALEAGRGNPTLDTLSAIAEVLGVEVPELVSANAGPALAVTRAADDPGAAADLEVRFLRRFRAGPCAIDLYDLHLAAGETRGSSGLADGVIEHVLVHEGQLEVSIAAPGHDGRSAVLGTGDYAAFTADAPYALTAVTGPVRAGLLLHYASDLAAPPVPVEPGDLPVRRAS